MCIHVTLLKINFLKENRLQVQCRVAGKDSTCFIIFPDVEGPFTLRVLTGLDFSGSECLP